MAFGEAFKRVVEKIAKDAMIMTIVSGTVKKVYDYELDVSRDGMADLEGVRFHSVVDEELGSKFKIVPKVGSEVLCAIIENDVSEAFLLACSEIELVQIKMDKLIFEVQKEGVRITNDGQNLKTVLNDFQDNFGKLCAEVNKIVVSIGTTPDVPAITAIQNAVIVENKSNLNKILIE